MIKYINYDKCTNCGSCAQVCPMDVFRTLGDLVFIAHKRDCMTCFLCEEACKFNAVYVDPHRGRKVVFPF